ncbi:MAG: MFS transporter [Propionibacteriaceae bacterium]|nr:MFS transporter [Propionibacteriaceae bacterium]
MLKRALGRSSLAMFWALDAPLRLVVATQFAFNVGFYLVVPFLAAHLASDLALAGWLIGLVLGLRTFSQQGMFFLGGALADRFGVRRAILVGCGIRIAGFVTLAFATGLAGVIAGVVLVGLAAALFSPATESAIVAWAGDAEAAGGPTRQEIIGLEIMASKLGTIVGPVLGGVLLVVPFRTTCLVAAAIFGVILVAQWVWLPRDARAGEPSSVRGALGEVLRNRRFLVFALIHSSYLLSYNQLYLAMPVELERIGAPSANITWMFGLAAVLTIALQTPLTRLALRWSYAATLGRGYGLLAASFLAVAGFAAWQPWPGLASYVPVVGFVVLLHLGQIFILPAARTVVADLAGGERLGSYLGMLATAGGLAVLAGSTAIGTILPWANQPAPGAAIPWAVLALPPAVSCVAAVLFCRRVRTSE